MSMIRSIAILTLALLVVVPTTLARGGNGGDGCDAATLLADLPYETVDTDEQAALVYMREEEKLARDVYRAMDDLWGLRVFRNIANAEQTHMDTMLALLEKYGIDDPVGANGFGVFVDPQLQALYGELVAQGSSSLSDALIVGATIEDLDIDDLEVDLAQTDNEDVATAFQNLQKGSRNHLRAFIGLLDGSGLTYEPQFISVVEFEAIVSSARERGAVDADGEPVDGSRCGRVGVRRHSGRAWSRR